MIRRKLFLLALAALFGPLAGCATLSPR